MSVPLNIFIVDGAGSAPADQKALAQSIVDWLNEEWASHGIAGVSIVEATLRNGVLAVGTKPGPQSLSVAALGEYLRDKRERRAA